MDQVKSDKFIRPWIYLNQIGQIWWQLNRIWIKRTVSHQPWRLHRWIRGHGGTSRGLPWGLPRRLQPAALLLGFPETAERGDEKQRKPGNMRMWFLWQSSQSIQYMNESETYLSSWRREKHGSDSGCNAIYYVQLVIICIYVNRYIDWYQEWAIHKIVYIHMSGCSYSGKVKTDMGHVHSKYVIFLSNTGILVREHTCVYINIRMKSKHNIYTKTHTGECHFTSYAAPLGDHLQLPRQHKPPDYSSGVFVHVDPQWRIPNNMV